MFFYLCLLITKLLYWSYTSFTIDIFQVHTEVTHLQSHSNRGNISAYTFLYVPNLVQLDLSRCTTIVPEDFVDVIGFVKNLKVITLDGCIQFSQHHFVNIFKQISSVEHLSIVECQPLPFTAAYCICSFLKELKFFDFEADNINLEMKDWKRLRAIFFKVKFSPKFLGECKDNW